MTIVEIVGFSASAMLMMSTVPQTLKVIRQRHAHGMSALYLSMSELGMLMMLTYVLCSSRSMPLVINYAFNGTMFGLMLAYRLFGARRP